MMVFKTLSTIFFFVADGNKKRICLTRIFCRHTRSQNTYLRFSKLRFLGFTSLKLSLVIQVLAKK